MTTLDAFHLPPGIVSDVADWGYQEYDGLRLRWPRLSAEQVTALCQQLKDARAQHLVTRKVDDIVDAVAAAARRLETQTTDLADTLSLVTGYSPPVVAQTIERMLADWSAQSLQALLRSELGHGRVLDTAVSDARAPNKRIAAFGFPLGFHVFSGNVPGIAVTSIIRSLLVKSGTLGKTATGEPLLPVLFARALAESAPELASSIAVTYWPKESDELIAAALEAADAIVVYGGDEAVRSIGSRVPPGRRFVVHGPRVSFAMAGTAASAADAEALADAVAAYDQQGCVSPHLVYVIGEAEQALGFARAIADRLAALAGTLPLGRISAEEAVAIRNVRTAAEFSSDTELLGSETDGYSVIVERDPTFRLSCLNRVLYVKPLPRPGDVSAHLPAREYLQSAALAGFSEKEKAGLIRQLGLAGISRITSFDQLPWPPMHWHHDGSAPLRELLYFQDIEI
jgi:hypothetical protein